MTNKTKNLMARVALVLGTVGLIGTIIVYELKRKPAPVAAPAIEARLELAAGEVLITQADVETAANGPTALLSGAKVRTGDGARALMRLPDGSSAFLRGATAIELGSDHVQLHDGEYWLDAPVVEREALAHRVGQVAVTAVDAGLSIRRDGGAVTVYVARGMAVVTGSGGRVEVHAGELAHIDGDAAPAVEAVSFWEDWTGGMADYGATVATVAAGNGEIYGIDRGGADGQPAARLQLKSQSVRAVVRNGLAETEVDQTFFNPAARAVEGWYWFSIPENASVTSFAVETNGALVEGELIERREAARKYTGAKRSGHAPAILEWIDSRTYRARIFPILPSATRRVVLRYSELLPTARGKLSYVYPMASRNALRIGEFALSVDLGAEGRKMDIATLAEARVESNGEQVTMRRSGYTPQVDFQLEAALPEREPAVRVSRFGTGGESADYLMARYTPDVDWAGATPPRADVVLVVDTSAGSDEATQRLQRTVTESILRSLSKDDRFTLVALDVTPRVLYPKEGLAAAEATHIAPALEALAERGTGGATDLAALFEVALARVHDAAQPAVVYVGDGLATTGEQTGEQLIERLRRALATSRARLFTVPVGTDADHALLAELARAGGGESMPVQDPRFATSTALQLTAAFKVPTLTDFELDLGAGLDEPLSNVSGKVTRGTEVVVLARTHHDLPKKVVVRAKLGDLRIDKEVRVLADDSVVSTFVPRLWAAAYVKRLLGSSAGPDAERGRISALGIDYGLMTPFTSILALESEAAYSNMGIRRRRSPLRGVRLTTLDRSAERQLGARLHGGAAPLAFGCSRTAPPGAGAAAEQQEVEDGEQGLTQRKAGDDGAPWGLSDNLRADTKSPADQQQLGLFASPASGGNQHKSIAGKLADRDGDVAPDVLGTCSAAARRPLAQRVAVWRKRLRTADDASALLSRYRAAARACELADWRSERTFLLLLQQLVDSEAAARQVLQALQRRPEVQRYVARLILRRAVDQRLVAAVESVLFGAPIDWAATDRKLSEIEDLGERIDQLRVVMARAPDDPNGIIRLVELLAKAGRSDEALALGRRLRNRGLMTVRVAHQLGDVLARAGLEHEAIRTYSEIVEFDASSRDSRRLLGDIYLSRSWFDDAYRQYRTLADDGNDALDWLRLANAAAGAGRVDEALRIDRSVSTAQGRPGPDDPRRWARLWSAARLAQLMANPPPGASGKALQRKLKELGLFRSEGTLVLVTWHDLNSDLVLTTRVGEDEMALGEATDAAAVGLSSALLTHADLTRATLVAILRSVPRQEPLAIWRHTVRWDGKSFAIETEEHELAAGETRITL